MTFFFSVYLTNTSDTIKIRHWGSSRAVIDKVLDYRLEVGEVELHSRFYVYFLINNEGKGMKPIFLQCMC